MPHQCTACGHTFEDGSKEMLSGCPDCGGNKFQFNPSGTTTDAADVSNVTDAADDVTDDEGAATHSPEQPERGSEPPKQNRPKSDRGSEPPKQNRPKSDTSSVTETVGRATTHLRDLVSPGSNPSPASGNPSPSDSPDPEAEWPDDWENRDDDRDNARSDSMSDGEIIDADARRKNTERTDSGEDFAQKSARSDVVTPSELDDNVTPSELDDGPTDTPTDAAGASHPTDASESSPPDAPERPTDGEVVSEPTGEEPDLADLREQLNDQFESIKILEPGQYELNLMELYDRDEYIIALQENGRYVIQVPEQWMGEDPDER